MSITLHRKNLRLVFPTSFSIFGLAGHILCSLSSYIGFPDFFD
jgi:hypothetical protein